MRHKGKMVQLIVWFVVFALLSALVYFAGKITYQKGEDWWKSRKEKAELKRAKSVALPKLNINLRPEDIFTEYKLPLKLYTLTIENSNKDSAPVVDFRIEFAFEHNVTETAQKILIPRGDIFVGGMESIERKKDGTTIFSEEQPVETSENKYFSLQIEKIKTNRVLTNTNFVVFNCEKWPNGALYIGKIVVDLSTKLPSILKKPYLIGKYEGEYSYEIMGRRFSGKVEGSIPLPNEKSGIKLNESDYMKIATKYYYEQNYDSAIRALEKAVKMKPDYVEAYKNWGIVLEEQNRYDEAIKKYKKAVELKPNYSEAYLSWGVTLGKQGKHEDAVKKFTKAVELKPDYAEAYFNWGVALVEQGRYEEAIKQITKAIELKPNYARAYLYWSVALGELDRYKEAIDKSVKAVELKPDYAEAYFNWGVALGKQGKPEEAIEKYKKAINLKSDYVKAYFNWGGTLVELGRYEEAVEKYKKAIDLKPDYAKAYYMLACTYSRLNNVELSCSYLKKAFEIDSKLKTIAKTDTNFNNVKDANCFIELIKG